MAGLRVGDRSPRTPDRAAASLAAAFIVLLLTTEAVLSLPDETADTAVVATFYTAHRTFIVILQILGFGAAALLAGYAWRLRRVDRAVSIAGTVMAACSVLPGLVTLVTALVADPASPSAAGRWNLLEPRADDVLFVGIVLFATAIAVRLGQSLPVLGVLALLVTVGCLIRLALEMNGANRGPLEAVAPLSFLILMAAMAASSFFGVLRTGVRRAPGLMSHEP
jgi:uncharacterized membrane protein